MRYACTRLLKFAEEQRRDSAQKKKKWGHCSIFLHTVLHDFRASGGSDGKGDVGSTPGSGRSSGERNGYPLH